MLNTILEFKPVELANVGMHLKINCAAVMRCSFGNNKCNFIIIFTDGVPFCNFGDLAFSQKFNTCLANHGFVVEKYDNCESGNHIHYKTSKCFLHQNFRQNI